MSEYKKIGIIVADEDEFKPLADLVTRGKFSESEFLKRRILRFKSGSADIYAMHCAVRRRDMEPDVSLCLADRRAHRAPVPPQPQPRIWQMKAAR